MNQMEREEKKEREREKVKQSERKACASRSLQLVAQMLHALVKDDIDTWGAQRKKKRMK